METAGVIGKGMRVKGRVEGTGRLVVEGEVEGRMLLKDSLSIEPTGVVNAEIQAEDVTIHGRAAGKVATGRRVEVKASAVFVGELCSPSVVIEDGAAFRGTVQMDVVSPTTTVVSLSKGAGPRARWP